MAHVGHFLYAWFWACRSVPLRVRKYLLLFFRAVGLRCFSGPWVYAVEGLVLGAFPFKRFCKHLPFTRLRVYFVASLHSKGLHPVLGPGPLLYPICSYCMPKLDL